MQAVFRRHLVGKTLRKLTCYYDSAQIRFVGKLVIVWTFSKTKLISVHM